MYIVGSCNVYTAVYTTDFSDVVNLG